MSSPTVPRPRTAAGIAGHFPDMSFEDMQRLATRLAGARLTVPAIYHNHPDDVLAVLFQAQALDVPPTVALQHFVFRAGKGGMSAALMQALIMRAGHSIHVLHADDKAVSMRLERCDGKPPVEVSWTMLEAQRAGLASQSNWKNYPGDLLWARCLSRLARRGAADVVQGMGYVPEELASSVPDEVPTDTDGPLDSDGHPTPSPDVVELLAELPTLTAAEIRALFYKARDAGLLKRYAGWVDGEEVTVEQVINSAGVAAADREQIAERAAAADEAAAQPAEPDAEPAPDGDRGVDQSPAGEGELPCGCSAQAVLATGEHQDICRDRGDR